MTRPPIVSRWPRHYEIITLGWIALYVLGALLILSGCASPPRIAPRFVAPSTAPIAEAHKRVGAAVSAARAKVIEIEKECPQAKAQINALTSDLDVASAELQTSEGARVQLETQLKQQTTQANNLADNYDKAAVQIESLKVSRHRWVKYFLTSSFLLLTSITWILRKPLLRMAGGFFGL